MTGRRWLGIVGAWLLTAGAAWGLVGLPEHCTTISAEQARAASVATVDWFEHNQRDDGSWVYRYNIDDGSVDLSPHTVRHAGVTMSLYQAHEAGIERSLTLADGGADWALDDTNLARHGDLAMMVDGRYAPSGGAALLAAGLAIRHRAEGPSVYDHDLYALGRFLVAMTEDTGAVLAHWDTGADAPVPDEYSLFFTGEAYFALALLAEIDPDGHHGDWTETASLIGRYLATERDEAEGLFPPTSDHWAAYGLGASAEAGLSLGEDEVAYAERLGEIFSIQVRYESQRTGDGVNRYLQRGPIALGAGVGTLGEGLGSLWLLTDDGGPLEDQREAVGERLSCVAGVLYDRQVDAEQAADSPEPGLAEGAWFRLGWTQKDDQQHALSALLLAEEALAEGGGRTSGAGDDSVAHVLWLMAIAVALANPMRLRRLLPAPPPDRAPDTPASTVATANRAVSGVATLLTGAAVTFTGLAAAAAVGSTLLAAIDVSAPTAMIGAGLIVALTAITDFVWPRAQKVSAASKFGGLFVPLVIPGLVRPATVLMAFAVGDHVGLGAGLAVAAATAATSLVMLLPATPAPPTPVDADEEAASGSPSPLAGYAWQALAALAVVGGVAMTADGIFSI